MTVKLYPVEFDVDNEEKTKYYASDVKQMDSKTHNEKTIYSDSFKVSVLAIPDLSVNIATGQCSFGGRFLSSDATENIKITANTTNYNRYDLIVADMEVGEIKALRGEPATNPVTPSATLSQIVLARVFVGAGASSIQSNNIEDLRFTTQNQYNIESLDKTVFEMKANKLEIYVSDVLPTVDKRKQNTIYCKITDKVSDGNSNTTIRVKPNLGIKVQE